MTRKLEQLKAQRAAIDAEIALRESAIRKAEYDACMFDQLVTINEARAQDGKPALSMSEFASGCFAE